MRVVAPQCEIAIWLAACAGLRLGEVLGLTWNNFDAARNRLSVTQQLQNREIRPVKTKASRATLPIDPMLTQKLLDHRSNFPSAASGRSIKSFHGSRDHQEWVMVNSHGDPLTAKRFFAKWNVARSVTSIPSRTPFHSLRHFYITALTESGRYSLTTIQSLARHGHIRSTLAYMRPIDSPDERGVNVFSTAFSEQHYR
ncbi:tyrosine-type recombinase/integrase [Streptomyces fagopyri]|uniref:tyrosine-type recombinase/integrase n=1 Tax=Streptomyces fagopyri TaxID=2662397 RepID=UPI00381B6503